MKSLPTARLPRLCLPVLASLTLAAALPSGRAQYRPDAFLQPFASDSIWNVPIGSNATYVSAGLQGTTLGYVVPDNERIYRTFANDPSRTVSGAGGSINIPDSLVVPRDLANNCVSFMLPDGLRVREYQPFVRPAGGNPSATIGYLFDIYGDGTFGGHPGADLPVIGGSIRTGELSDNNPNNAIRHAIKIEFDWAVLYRSTTSSANRYQTYRWPATTSDVRGSAYPNYTGTVPAFRMGSLMAIRPTDGNGNPITAASLGIQTVPGRKLLKVLQDYGAYVVDTSADHLYWANVGYGINICLEDAEVAQFASTYGFNFKIDRNAGVPSAQAAWNSDLNILHRNLYVVDNNAPASIGGGGTPRQPLLPPLNPAVYPQNVAKLKPATASTNASLAGLAVDADPAPVGSTTKWYASGAGNTNWWEVDLQGTFTLTRADIAWEADYLAYGYRIDAWTGSSWSTVIDRSTNTNNGRTSDVLNFFGVQKVRIYGTNMPSGAWMAIRDVKIWALSPGTTTNGTTNLSLGTVATATASDGASPNNARDGSVATRWTAANGATGKWWRVDLGATYTNLTKVTLRWEQSWSVYQYRIEVSTTGTGGWTTVVDQTARTTAVGAAVTHTFAASTGRYVRVTATGLPGGQWASLNEVEVY